MTEGALKASWSVFAIRHIPTQEFMPCRMNKGHTGWSYWSPGNQDDPPYDRNPRLFFSRQSATNALTMWLQGVWKRDRFVSYSYFGEAESSDDLTVNTPPIPRKREEMEIVEFKLMET